MFLFPLSEASCRAAIRTARNIVKDVGVEQARNVGGLLGLARCSQSHSERDTRGLLSQKLGLALPIPLRAVPDSVDPSVHEKNRLRMLTMKDWASFFLRTNNWRVLCGLRSPNPEREQAIWKSWWQKYEQIDPGHPIFAMAQRGEVALSKTAAVVVHGDEGRGRRRQAFFVLSFHSVLGRGTVASLEKSKKPNARRVRKPYLKMGLNFKGHSYTTRFVLGVLPRHLYADKDRNFTSLLRAVYHDAASMATTGVVDRKGCRHWLCAVRTIGDWPFLHKAGNLDRTYANTVKSVNQASSGICHLCCAGEPNIPFEQIATRRPDWLDRPCTTSPFKDGILPEAACLPHAPGRLPNHYAYDIFHTFHLGVAKNFLGAVLARLSDFESGNVEQRFEALTVKYRTWCRATGNAPIVSKLTKDLIQWETTSDYPNGSWYKGGLSTNLMLFFESLDGTLSDPLLLLAMDGAKAINLFFRTLYAEGFWLSPAVASFTGQLASKFLRRYEECARLAHSEQATLFVLQPKLRPLHHFAVDLLRAVQAGHEAINPLGFSTQMSEDLVGRPSRLGRRVATPLVCQRVLERYLQSSYGEWVKAGLLIESKGSA